MISDYGEGGILQEWWQKCVNQDQVHTQVHNKAFQNAKNYYWIEQNLSKYDSCLAGDYCLTHSTDKDPPNPRNSQDN